MEEPPPENILVGRNPVLEALKAGTPVEKVYLLHGLRGGAVGKIVHMAKRQGVPCVEVGKQKLRDVAGDAPSQGVVALVGTKSYADLDEILSVGAARSEPAFVLVLDEIED